MSSKEPYKKATHKKKCVSKEEYVAKQRELKKVRRSENMIPDPPEKLILI